MPTYVSPVSQPFPKRVIDEFDRQVQPNVYAVGHLHRCLWDAELRIGRPGTIEAYDIEAYKLMANLTKRLIGKTAYRKRPVHRKRLPNFVTLESMTDRPHLNILIRKPDAFTFDELKAALVDEWAALTWTVKGPSALWIEPRVGNCVRYSFKEGNESLLPRSYCFHR